MFVPGRGYLVFRHITPLDAEALHELFLSHSEETVRQRYFTRIHDLTPQQLKAFTELDPQHAAAIVAEQSEEARHPLRAVARYFVNSRAPIRAELAVTVHDDWQGKGVGSRLFQQSHFT